MVRKLYFDESRTNQANSGRENNQSRRTNSKTIAHLLPLDLSSKTASSSLWLDRARQGRSRRNGMPQSPLVLHEQTEGMEPLFSIYFTTWGRWQHHPDGESPSTKRKEWWCTYRGARGRGLSRRSLSWQRRWRRRRRRRQRPRCRQSSCFFLDLSFCLPVSTHCCYVFLISVCPCFIHLYQTSTQQIGFSIFLESSIQRTFKLWIKIRKTILKFEFRWKLEALGVGGLNSEGLLEVWWQLRLDDVGF